jgi:hypothetical protein
MAEEPNIVKLEDIRMLVPICLDVCPSIITHLSKVLRLNEARPRQ